MAIQVLAGGFPKSGTSFLGKLISWMGFNPGSTMYLKPPNSHNPRGYWEHLPIRCVTWGSIGGELDIQNLPGRAFSPDEKIAVCINRIAEADSVEVYKDTALPIVHRFFPSVKKCVLIERRVREIHRSWDFRYGHLDKTIFAQYWQEYADLVDVMRTERSTYTVQYENFFEDIEGEIRGICEYLAVPYSPELPNTFRPTHKPGKRR